ncbi:hypothetical protein GTZ99_14375 [Novosphingobium sp. FSY-8]|uniref:C-deglycosylation enzyme beta subunit n=1 Tax=Novosphingobium ovatum TaxID=1908523 RepID=A0ABW9XGQ4_9SPHN|nr:DUF6379 domain-containing protein [Novosphingobium ovatum]NBC37738.1 hypothetical protein [Novosphingobium ovatum]
MLPVERVIAEEGLVATPRGARLGMRLTWYRSLPFSTVEVASVAIDGAPVDLSDAVVEYDDQSWPLAEMGEQTNSFWFIRDSAFLVLPQVQLTPGDAHEVTLVLNVNPPYIPGMKRVNPQTATLTVG